MRDTLRPSWRSTTAPAMGATKVEGKNSAKDMMPSQAPEWVSCQVTQPTAIRCIQVPMSETKLPEAYTR